LVSPLDYQNVKERIKKPLCERDCKIRPFFILFK